MTLAQLRAFLAAFDTGSFTAAAIRLQTAQASVSELVARLEDELHTPLFVRAPRGLVPTEAGLILRPHAVESLAAADAGCRAVDSLRSLTSGVCTFGVLRNAAYYDLADLAATFHTQHPGVQLRMVGLNSVLVAESVRRGELEAGLVVLPIGTEGLTVVPLFDDEVLLCSSTRPRSAGPVAEEELAHLTWVLYDAHVGWKDPTRRQLALRIAAQDAPPIAPGIEVEHVETALRLVASGAGDTVVSRSIARSPHFPASLRTFEFATPFHETIALITRSGAEVSPATQRMIALARRSLRV